MIQITLIGSLVVTLIFSVVALKTMGDVGKEIPTPKHKATACIGTSVPCLDSVKNSKDK